jgi:peptidoglycan/xylan/chitin deacetylase (PgdA/CDA1 family)
MNLFFHRSPLLLRWLFPAYHWKIETAKPVIYLTFDDGPIPRVTEYVMKELESFNASGTFFCIGDNVRKYPEIFQELKRRGHSIGNHTYHHLNGWKTDTTTYLDNFRKCQDVLETDTCLFRPPYGRIRRDQYRLLPEHTKVIMWDVLTGDFSPDIVEEKALHSCVRSTRPGTIMVFHDSLKAEKKMTYMLPRILEHFSEKGYRFEALPMKWRGELGIESWELRVGN